MKNNTLSEGFWQKILRSYECSISAVCLIYHNSLPIPFNTVAVFAFCLFEMHCHFILPYMPMWPFFEVSCSMTSVILTKFYHKHKQSNLFLSLYSSPWSPNISSSPFSNTFCLKDILLLLSIKQVGSLLTCIWEMPNLNIGTYVKYPQLFLDFPHHLQENSCRVP